MIRKVRFFRWAAVILGGLAPAFVMRCDKAALNVQRGFYQGLGEVLGEQVGAIVSDEADNAEGE